MVCLLAAPWVQLSVRAGNGWPHNALRHHWLMPICCHFRHCKALLVTCLIHASGAIAYSKYPDLYLYIRTVVSYRICSSDSSTLHSPSRACGLTASMMHCRAVDIAQRSTTTRYRPHRRRLISCCHWCDSRCLRSRTPMHCSRWHGVEKSGNNNVAEFSINQSKRSSAQELHPTPFVQFYWRFSFSIFRPKKFIFQRIWTKTSPAHRIHFCAPNVTSRVGNFPWVVGPTPTTLSIW